MEKCSLSLLSGFLHLEMFSGNPCLFVCLFVCLKIVPKYTIKYYCFAIFVPGKHFGIPCKDISQCYLLVCKMDRRKQFSTHALRLTGSVDS